MANTSSLSLDTDTQETQEWLQALNDVVELQGLGRAQAILEQLLAKAQNLGVTAAAGFNTPYCNTIRVEDEVALPGKPDVAKQLRALIRWNAIAMVLKAVKQHPDLGGHLASYASAATLYEVGFNHFFHARTQDHLGDLVFVQGHSSPGIYARAFLEGRLSEKDLANFRQEVDKPGLSSYPHPWLMPDFWQFPTVSMGLGPLQAIYQAHILKYLENRSLILKQQRKVWMFCGDGEMDEPESRGALHLATMEKLDNLIFVINCNLQRLDGPVRGDGKIIQELEAQFRGIGWHVIKVVWGGRWDELFAKDTSGLLLKRMQECVDGDYQNYKANDGAYVRAHFFGKYPELAALVADMTDEEIWALNRGGHDPQKVYNAYKQAVKHRGQPTVILAKTVKGYGLGVAAGEGQNFTHNIKKMKHEDLKSFCEAFDIPIPENKLDEVPFYRPDDKSPEISYLQERRERLGGFLPARFAKAPKLKVPNLAAFKNHLEGTGEREISTTMAYVRIIAALVKDTHIGKHVVPIVADESRTFGMEGLFRQIGIYAHEGQKYTPVDSKQVMYYREAQDGQLLQEGLNEAGAFGSWMALASSYSTHGVPMIPFYIYYSMFGFQRIGDFAWAAGDMRCRGFLIGAVSGRTTLAGEGLQHQDGHSHLNFSAIPNCITYDPTFNYELAVIIQDGLRRMVFNQEDIYYYITVMNENYVHPAMPKGVEKGILKGMYCFKKSALKTNLKVQLLGCGSILREVIAAEEILRTEYKVSADIWSVTSFNELRRDALAIARHNRLHPEAKPKTSYITECLQYQPGPVIAATDYMKLFADQVREFIPQRTVVLGTDGFGRSDTRVKLRQFFEVDRHSIVIAALKALADEGLFPAQKVTSAMKKYGIDPNKPDPVTV